MTNEQIWAFGPLVIMLVLMWLLILRPQRKKDKEIQAMRAGIRVGDDIVTIGGLVGKVVKVKDNSFIIMVGSDKTKMEVMRWAINSTGKIDTPNADKEDIDVDVEEEASTGKPEPKKLGE